MTAELLLLIAFVVGLWLGVALRDDSLKSKKGYVRVARGPIRPEPPTPQPKRHQHYTHSEER